MVGSRFASWSSCFSFRLARLESPQRKKKSGTPTIAFCSHVNLREGMGGPLRFSFLRGSFGRLSARAPGSSPRPGARQQTPIRTALVRVGRPCRPGDTSAEFRRGRAPRGALADYLFLFRATYSARVMGGLARRPRPLHWVFGNYGRDVIRGAVQRGDSCLTSDCMRASRAGKLRSLIWRSRVS